MTRVQKERFFNEDDYLRLRDTYILDEAKMAYAKKDMGPFEHSDRDLR